MFSLLSIQTIAPFLLVAVAALVPSSDSLVARQSGGAVTVGIADSCAFPSVCFTVPCLLSPPLSLDSPLHCMFSCPSSVTDTPFSFTNSHQLRLDPALDGPRHPLLAL